MAFVTEPRPASTPARNEEALERIAASHEATARRHEQIAAAMDRVGRFELAELHEREAARARRRGAEERARAAGLLELGAPSR
jgi:hypothetical protein